MNYYKNDSQEQGKSAQGEALVARNINTPPEGISEPQIPWSAVVKVFLDSNIDSENTRIAYARHVTDALAWLLPNEAPLAVLSAAELANYRAHLLADGRGVATHCQALAAVRSFFRWASGVGATRVSSDALRVVLKPPRSHVVRPYQILSDDEVSGLLRVAVDPRDRAIVAIMVGAGLRVSEITNLDVDDLIEDAEGKPLLHVREGKGKKDRLVPLGDDVAAIVRCYLAETGRRLHEPGPLFRAHDRGAERRIRRRLTVRAIGALVERLIDRAGIRAKRITPHSLRHTLAIRFLRNGGNVVKLGKILGHASLSTTQLYVDHLLLGELRDDLPRLPTV